MFESRSRRLLAAALAASLFPTGCGSGGPAVETSETEARVKGKVVIKGKSVAKGEIVFDPANRLRVSATPRRATIGADGSYAVTTLIGENSVRYEGPAGGRDRNVDGAVVGYVVKEGDNQFDLVLPPE